MRQNVRTIHSSKAPLLVALSILAVATACYFLIPTFQDWLKEAFDVLTSKDEQRIKSWVSQFGMIGPVVLVLIMIIQMFLFVVPNVLVMIIAITSYGPVWGSLIALVGIFLSSTLGFFIGRYLSPAFVRKFLSEKTEKKIASFIQDYGVAFIAITRLSSLSNDSLSIAAGVLKMRYRNYILATLSGITPLIILLALYGKNGKIEKALIWIGAISLVLFIVYIIIDRKRKRRSESGDGDEQN